MALKYCRYCGKQVSDKAAACPHCGSPVASGAAPQSAEPAAVKHSGNKTPLIIAIAAVLIAAIVGAVIIITRNSDNSSKVGKSDDPANSLLVLDPGNGKDGSDGENNNAPKKFNVELKVELEHNEEFSTYPVDVYVDDTMLVTLLDSDVYDQVLSLEQGVHTIAFKNNQYPDNDKYTTELKETITDYTVLSYSLKRHNTLRGGIKAERKK